MNAGTSEAPSIRGDWLGSTHNIELQLACADNADDAETAPESAEYTVLVIEDDEASAALACSVLDDAGYAVSLAGSGAEGIEAFLRVSPHCILLDARLPFLDGYETCRRLRALPGGLEVPIVFMTTDRSVDSFDRAYACGADDFLTRPFAPDELLGHIHSGLALGRLRTSDDYALVKNQRDQLVRRQLHQERLNLLLVHDLKAPLNSISLLAQGLLRGAGLHASDRGMAEEIWIRAREMAAMVLDLLDIGKAREGKLIAQRESVDLRELIEQLLTDFRVIAGSRGVTLESCVFATQVEADKKLLRRVLANLIDNALQHAPYGTTVLVTASPRAEHTDICVADAGGGISSARRTEVFEAFSQMGLGAADGRGLGLTFCRWAVEAHGGRIWIEDGSPGCVICLALPNEGSALL